MERIETTILRNLVCEEEFSRKVIPFIEPDYFENKTERVIFQEISQLNQVTIDYLQVHHQKFL